MLQTVVQGGAWVVWEVVMMFSKVGLGASAGGVIRLCLQPLGVSWGRGSRGDLCGPRGQSQEKGTESSFSSVTRKDLVAGRECIMGEVGSPSADVQQRTGDRL